MCLKKLMSIFGIMAAFSDNAQSESRIKPNDIPEIKLHTANSLNHAGRKEYGMYLQATGRQKWTKRKK